VSARRRVARQLTQDLSLRHNALRQEESMDRHLIRVGILAGLIGATVVALWFLVVDALAGRMLSTPIALGSSILDTFGVAPGRDRIVSVLLYSLVHYGVFVIIGIIGSHAVHAMRANPSLTMAFEILLVVVLIVISLFSLTLSQSPMFAGIAWYEIWVANVLAAVAMGFYLKSRVWATSSEPLEVRL
jgi:hypothetical protein